MHVSTPVDRPTSTSVVNAVHAALRSLDAAALHEPEFNGREWDYVKECLDTGWVSSVGKFVDRFEQMLSLKLGAKHAVATMNGTAALHVCLLLAGVQPRDEVLIPSLTFVATANAVKYAGAIPHFVDSEHQSLGVDPVRLDRYLNEIAEVRHNCCVNRITGATIRALMPMHTFGLVGDLDAMNDLCSRWKLTLIEDAAESLGSTYKNRFAGTFGKLAALSFNGNKIVTTGGGGAILTNNEDLARRAKHLTTTARVQHKWSFLHDEVGFNYRLPNINAALGCAQLEQLDGFLLRKRELLNRYLAAFRGVDGIKVMQESGDSRSNYWLVALILDHPDLQLRDEILTGLNEAGFMSRPSWTLMHRLPMYATCPRMDMCCAESLELRIINVPSSAKLVREQ